MPDPREPLAKIVRDTWVATARELLDDPKPSWLVPWDELADPFQREADMRIGAVVAAAERERIREWCRSQAESCREAARHPSYAEDDESVAILAGQVLAFERLTEKFSHLPPKGEPRA